MAIKANSYQVKSAETVFYKPDVHTARSFLKTDKAFCNVIYLFGILGIFFCIRACFSNGTNTAVFIYSTITLYIMIIGALFLTDEHKDDKEAVVPNEPGKDYMLHIGNEVEKFYGDAVQSSKKKGNQKRPLLVNAETVKRHFLVMATIGAGKSVWMKGMIEQMTAMGGGCLIIDGKGTDEFAKEIYGIVGSLGREDDFVYLNFLDMNNTHTINPLLAGSALSIYEIFIALLIGEEDVWKAKQKEFMKNVLKLMVWKRDNEGFAFNFSELANRMSLEALLKEAMDYKKYARQYVEIEDFCQFVVTSCSLDYLEFLKGDENDQKWRDAQLKALAQNKDAQGVYDASVSIGAWRSVLTNLKSDYGRIFNTQTPNMSLWEATQRNKIVFVTLPTMDSDTTPKELGRLILGLIKGVAAQKARDAREPKLPFVCFCDEIGSYVVEGFGRLESKSRSLGVSMCPIFQSPAQLDGVGKSVGSESLERREIIDVTGVHILMKNMHPETTKFYADFTEKKIVVSKDFSKRRDFVQGQGNTEDTFKTEEKAAIEHDEVVNMNNGEMIVFANGKMHRAVARAESTLTTMGKKITYMGKTKDKIPLTQYVPKREFFTKVHKALNRKRLKGLFPEVEKYNLRNDEINQNTEVA